MSKNPAWYSHKFKQAAVDYEIAISIFTQQVVWISGPHKGSRHDITTFREEEDGKEDEDHLLSDEEQDEEQDEEEGEDGLPPLGNEAVVEVVEDQDEEHHGAGGLKARMPAGKYAIGDKGYRGEPGMISTPNSHDPPEVRLFKGRARARQETFNARIKTFACLEKRYHHGLEKQKITFEAVCVIVQYQMENGSPLFQV
jgi:hypothetical protein